MTCLLHPLSLDCSNCTYRREHVIESPIAQFSQLPVTLPRCPLTPSFCVSASVSETHTEPRVKYYVWVVPWISVTDWSLSWMRICSLWGKNCICNIVWTVIRQGMGYITYWSSLLLIWTKLLSFLELSLSVIHTPYFDYLFQSLLICYKVNFLYP
jgi:hypothetical protein